MNKENKEDIEKYSNSIILSFYKRIIYSLIVIDFIIVLFFVSYKLKISNIDTENQSISNKLIDKTRNNTKQEILNNHIFTNLIGSNRVFHQEFTSNIYTVEEYDLMTKWLSSTYTKTFMCYTSNSPHLKYGINEYCQYGDNWIVIVKTTLGHRFGVSIDPNSYGGTKKGDKEAFLFNFDTKKSFPINNSLNGYKISEDNSTLQFGEDIVIKLKDLSSNSSYSKFPQSFGDVSKNIVTELTGGEINFSIDCLEIFSKMNI